METKPIGKSFKRICIHCFDNGADKIIKGKWVCSSCLEYNNVNFEAWQ
jgi:hypothetical protein